MVLIPALMRRATCVLGATLLLASCGSHKDASSSSGHSNSAASASPTIKAPRPSSDPHAPSVASAPKLASHGITSLTSGANVKGQAVYPIPSGLKKGQTLAIAINCQGPGRLHVRVQPTEVSFPLLCEKGKVLPTMNEIHMSKDRTTGSLQFTGDAEVTWSFAVGWDPHPPERQ